MTTEALKPSDEIIQALEQQAQGKDYGGLIQAVQRVLSDFPAWAQGYYLLGMGQFFTGDHVSAVNNLCRARELEPDNPNIWHDLGLVYRQQRSLDLAEASLSKALSMLPERVTYLYSLSQVKQDRQHYPEALALLERALAADPQNSLCRLAKASVLVSLKRFTESEALLQVLHQEAPKDFAVLNILGNHFLGLGDIAQATRAYDQALSLNPNQPDLWNNRGLIYRDQGARAEAIQCFERAQSLNPYNPIYIYNQVTTLREDGDLVQAKTLLAPVLEAHPQESRFLHEQAIIDNQLGNYDSARQTFLKAVSFCTPQQHGYKQFHAQTLCPIITTSSDEILACRERIQVALDNTPTDILRGLPLAKLPLTQIHPSFYLAYQGHDDTAIKRQWGDFIESCLQSLDVEVLWAPVVSPAGVKPRLGFLVTYPHEKAFLTLMTGIMNRLDYHVFDVVIVAAPSQIPTMQAKLGHLPLAWQPLNHNNFERAVTDIRALGLTGLIYFEVGTDGTNSLLPFFNLAPWQATLWGFPVTSGIPQLTHFISAVSVEPKEAFTHYRETLIQLDRLPCFWQPQQTQCPPAHREDYGFSERDHLYWCAQNLSKLHPDFDPWLADILARDPQAQLLLIRDNEDSHHRIIIDRFRKHLPQEDYGRVHVLPRLKSDAFRSVMQMVDVLLDTPFFSGGITSYESVELGVPVVTYNAPWMRGLVTGGIYRQMGLEELITDSREAYVAKAVKIATDPDYRAYLTEQIKARASEVIADTRAGEAFNQMLVDQLLSPQLLTPQLLTP